MRQQIFVIPAGGAQDMTRHEAGNDPSSMLRLNIGSGKLSSCMLSIGLGPKCEQGKGGSRPLALNGFGSSANAEHA